MVRIILIIMLIDSGKRLVKPLKRQEQKFLFNGSPFVVVKSWNRRYLNKSGNGDSDFSLEVL
jgi:hypothetical protein